MAAVSSAPLVALGPLLTARWEHADHLTAVLGALALLGAALPFCAGWALGRVRTASYGVASALWGSGVTAAGLWPHTALGPVRLREAALAVAVAAALGLGVRHVLPARGEGESPLLPDALVLGTCLALAAGEVLVRTGSAPGPAALAVVLLACAHAGTCLALGVEHPALRRAAAASGTASAAVALTALATGPHLAHAALVTALAAGFTAAVGAPSGPTRHSGEASARAVHRLRRVPLTPAVALSASVLLALAAPRPEPLLGVLQLLVVLAAAVRYVTSARAQARTTAHLAFQALHDDLTGLGNRAALRRALTGPDGEQHLVLLELAGLDDVNDVLGVTTGDALVSAAAERVRAVAAPLGASAYRTSGDEIAVLVAGDAGEAARLARTLVRAVADAPAHVPGATRFPLAATAGVAACAPAGDGDAGEGPAGTHDPVAALVRADTALRHARLSGPGHVSVYSGAVAAAHDHRTLLRERLAAAVRAGTVDVHFQPVVCLRTGRVAKFEALARWEDPVLGRVSPGEFVAVAEEANLVVALGEHVLRSAVRWAHEAGVFAAGTGLAVNVSVVQLQSPGFAGTVRDVLARHDVPAHLLTLELTESVFLDADSPAERAVTELAALGCRIAIDDFGTGYSAFGYLDRLPVHVLKIDRSLTGSLTDAGNGRSVVTCVVDLATRLGLTVVVEGVETEEQAAACRDMRAPLGQGWLYSAAVPRTALGEQLTRTYPVPALVAPGV